MTTKLALSTSAEEAVAPFVANAAKIGRVVEVCPLDTQEDEAKAAALLVAIKGMIKSLEAERKALIGPADKEVRAANAAYRAPRKDLERVEALLKKRLGEAQAAREAARAAALSETTRAVAEGDTAAAEAALAHARDQEGPALSGISYRDGWEIVLVNVHAVPREYMFVDVARVRAALKANPDLQIEGLQITRTKKVAARAK